MKKITIALWQAEDIFEVVDNIKQLKDIYQIKKIVFEMDSTTRPEHIRLLFAAIEQYNNNNNISAIERLTLQLERNALPWADQLQHFGSLTKLHGLISSTKYFKLRCNIGHWDGLFPEIVSVLQSGTNFNQFEFDFLHLFGDDVPVEFKEFSDYFCERKDQLLSLDIHHLAFSEAAVPHLVQLIRTSRALNYLSLSFLVYKDTNIDIFEALANSNVRTLYLDLQDKHSTARPDVHSALGKFIGHSPTLEKFQLMADRSNSFSNEEIKRGFKMTQSLRKFTLHHPDEDALPILSILEENESIVECHIGQFTAKDKIRALTLRNKKLQNERVRGMIVLLYNIARFNINGNTTTGDNNSSNGEAFILPGELWASIMGHVKYPGVILDFGSIARSIFKDQTIRQVININK